MHGCKGDEGDRSGDEGPALSLHSQEGDTEAALVVCSADQPAASCEQNASPVSRQGNVLLTMLHHNAAAADC